MAWEGWLCFAGVELINNARTAAYATRYGELFRCPGCVWLGPSLGDPPYTSPEQDNAPWYDPAVPESADFCGLIGLELIGTGGTGGTAWTDLLGDGAVPGPLRRAGRELAVRAVAVAGDDAALSYGLAWLASALRGSRCQTCAGDELMLYAACPSPPPQPTPDGDCIEPGQTWVSPTATPVERGNEMVRHLYHCALLDGPDPGTRRRLTGVVTVEVTFTIKAGVPHWYREPVLVAPDPDPGDTWTGLQYDWDPDAIDADCRDQRQQLSQECLRDPDNSQLPNCRQPMPPPIPKPPVDPCYPAGPYEIAQRTIVRVNRATAPDWLEKVPIVTLATGGALQRRVMVRWYDNPADKPAHPDNLDPCTVCAWFTVAYLPPNSTLRIDGRVRRAIVECAGNRIAEPTLYGPRGGPYTWPLLECTAMFLEVAIDGRYPVAPDSTLRVFMAAREDAC